MNERRQRASISPLTFFRVIGGAWKDLNTADTNRTRIKFACVATPPTTDEKEKKKKKREAQ